MRQDAFFLQAELRRATTAVVACRKRTSLLWRHERSQISGKGFNLCILHRQLPITGFAHKAGVVGDDGVPARFVLTARNVATERGRAAALDRAHRLELAEAHMAAIGTTPSGPVIA